MNNERKCLYCSEPIPSEKRWDAKFCGNTCKAKHWEETKDLQKKSEPVSAQEQRLLTPSSAQPKSKPELKPQQPEGLRGVIETKPQADGLETNVLDVKQTTISLLSAISSPPQTWLTKWVEQQVETPIYQNIANQLREMKIQAEKFRNILKDCDNQIYQITNGNDATLPKGAAVAGGLIGYTQSRKNLLVTLAGTVLGFGAGKVIDHYLLEDDRKKEAEESLASLRKKKAEVQKELNVQNEQIGIANKHLSKVTRYEIKRVERKAFTPLLLQNIFKDDKKNSIEKTEEKIQAQEKNQKIEPKAEEQNLSNTETNRTLNGHTEIQTSDRLISSKQLKEIDYKCLNFEGRWKEFFGQPAVVFHLAVYGKPGEGKSTFCIQLACYLAKNFGYVVYISGEEGFSKTLKDKVINNKAESPYLFFSNYKSFDEVKQNLENKFHFIFIDSLDILKIDAVRLRELRKVYPNSAFITISQSTKDGNMRGSHEIIHDADIAVKVEKGIAITIKNRFHERGTEFNVFPDSGKTGGIIKTPRNVI